jgi:hypothetical protein
MITMPNANITPALSARGPVTDFRDVPRTNPPTRARRQCSRAIIRFPAAGAGPPEASACSEVPRAIQCGPKQNGQFRPFAGVAKFLRSGRSPPSKYLQQLHRCGGTAMDSWPAVRLTLRHDDARAEHSSVPKLHCDCRAFCAFGVLSPPNQLSRDSGFQRKRNKMNPKVHRAAGSSESRAARYHS